MMAERVALEIPRPRTLPASICDFADSGLMMIAETWPAITPFSAGAIPL